MELSINIEEAAKIFSSADTVKGIVDLVKTKSEAIGLNVIGYHCLPPVGMPDSRTVSFITFQNYSQQDDKMYRESGCYRHNPFISEPLRQAKVLRWSDIVKVPTLTRRNKKFIEVLSQRFQGDGLAIPVFGPQGQNGVVYIAFQDHQDAMHKDDIAKLQMACQHGHLAICAALKGESKQAISLTRRERELLDLLVLGKSNVEIARLLGISPHTVNSYLRQLFLKLGTTDRVSTAIRSLSLGVII